MKYILAAVFLISTALAYPVADQDEVKSEVPLVITDYSSIAKSEPSSSEPQVPQDVSHETQHQQDSAESNESAGSSESGEQKEPIPLPSALPTQQEPQQPLLDEKPEPALPIPSLPEPQKPEPAQPEPQLKELEEPIALVENKEKQAPAEPEIKLPEIAPASEPAVEPKSDLVELEKPAPVVPLPEVVADPIPLPLPIEAPAPIEPVAPELPIQKVISLEQEALPAIKAEEPLLENKLEEEKPLENQLEQKSIPDEPKLENSVVSEEKAPEPAVSLDLVPQQVVEEIKVILPEEPKVEAAESKEAPAEVLPELKQEPAKESLPALAAESLPLPAESAPAPAEKAADLPEPEVKLDEIQPIIAVDPPAPALAEIPLKKAPESEETSASVEKLPEPSLSS